MVREDIVGGLKNAIERGESEEEAKQSFVNANYPEDEINSAMSFLKSHQEEVEIPKEIKKKAESSIEEIRETRDINELKKQEIKEVSMLYLQKKKSHYIKYFLIGGFLALIIAVISILFALKVIHL